MEMKWTKHSTQTYPSKQLAAKNFAIYFLLQIVHGVFFISVSLFFFGCFLVNINIVINLSVSYLYYHVDTFFIWKIVNNRVILLIYV